MCVTAWILCTLPHVVCDLSYVMQFLLHRCHTVISALTTTMYHVQYRQLCLLSLYSIGPAMMRVHGCCQTSTICMYYAMRKNSTPNVCACN